MGATTFVTYAKGKDAKAAFKKAVKEAQYDYGHAGYTGTIAEKHEFIEIPAPIGIPFEDAAYKLCNDARFLDKWGPAGCFMIAEGEYVFFGWASE